MDRERPSLSRIVQLRENLFAGVACTIERSSMLDLHNGEELYSGSSRA
jgi:hypothetical protein